VSGAAPRIPPLPVDEWSDDEVAALRAAYGDDGAERLLSQAPGGPRMPNVLGTMIRHPRLAGPFLAYNNVLLRAPALEPRLRELLVLRVAWRTRAPYEWLQHVRLAPRWGITAEEVDAIAAGTNAGVWSSLEGDLLAATDQLLDQYRVDDATWARLAQHLDDRQLLEVLFVVGTYACLAMAFNSVGLALDPDLHDVVAPRLPNP
jgi:4-carboxymuconolactone decarboxylase